MREIASLVLLGTEGTCSNYAVNLVVVLALKRLKNHWLYKLVWYFGTIENNELLKRPWKTATIISLSQALSVKTNGKQSDENSHNQYYGRLENYDEQRPLDCTLKQDGT